MSPWPTERTRAGTLRSKLGERVVGLFAVCVVFPLLAVGVLCLWGVRTGLIAQADARLERSAEAASVAVLERLLAAERALAQDPAEPAEPFAARWSLAREGQALDARGPDLGPWSARERAQLARGGTVLRWSAAADARVEAVLVRGSGQRLVAGRIAWADQLEAAAEHATVPEAELCAGTAAGLLGCWPRAVQAAEPEALPRVAGGAGLADWTLRGRRYRAAQRTLALRAPFAADDLAISVAQPVDGILAPVEAWGGRAALLVGLLLCVLLGACLALVRRLLRPLGQLGAATRALAERDYAVRVEVDSGDELEALAASFNEMALRVGRHLDVLDRVGDIERAVLGSTEPRQIVDTVLWRFPELCPMAWLGMLLPAAERGRPGQLHWRDLAATGPLRERELMLDADFWTELEQVPPIALLPSVHELSSLIDVGARRRIRELVQLPLHCGGRVLGVLLVGLETPVGDPELLKPLRQVADQTSIALSNGQMVADAQHQAHHDPLTELPNRSLLEERLGQAITHARRHDHQVAVLFVDLDHFKRINDSLGHDDGDRLLCAVARRLSTTLRRSDTLGTTSLGARYDVGRLGADSFIVLLTDITAADEATGVAKRLLRGLEEPFEIGAAEVTVSASIGISIFPDDGDDVGALFKNADAAMYRAKEEGRNDFRYFSPTMNERAFERLGRETRLRRSLEEGDLELHYQPIVDAKSGRLVSVEALARWSDPEHGPVPPEQFIAIAETTGLIVPLGRWVLRTACAQLARWHELAALRVSVNVSARQIQDRGFVESVHDALLWSGVPAGRLVLEITESALMSSSRANAQTLHELRELGVGLAIDDFGTGYSSMRYLRDFPIDYLKIDKSFIDPIARDARARSVVSAIIALGHALDLCVVAEGIELEVQRDALLALGCDRIQGFWFSTAVPADEIARLLSEGGDLEP